MAVNFPYQKLASRTRTREWQRFDKAIRGTLSDLKAAAPVDSGATRRSGRTTDIRVTPTSRTRTIEFGEAAAFTNFGTAPHKIRVLTAKVLTDGSNFFGTEVNHPGQEGTKWLTGNAAEIFVRNLKAS